MNSKNGDKYTDREVEQTNKKTYAGNLPVSLLAHLSRNLSVHNVVFQPHTTVFKQLINTLFLKHNTWKKCV